MLFFIKKCNFVEWRLTHVAAYQTSVGLFLNFFLIYTPGSIDPQGKKLEAKNKYPWWLEVRVFLGEAEGVHNQSRVEALYERIVLYEYCIKRRWN